LVDSLEQRDKIVDKDLKAVDKRLNRHRSDITGLGKEEGSIKERVDSLERENDILRAQVCENGDR